MKDNRQVVILDLDDILPNRFQPRIKFDEKAIVELSESIKEHGVIQPIIVRKIDDKFEIIAGERRYKASVMAGKTTIPAIIVDLNDKESSEIALIENVQRKDLTPIEEAISYRKIFDMGNITQEELATKLGVSQSTIANKMRLLNLDDEVQDALLDEKISERHARSLLKLSKMSEQREMLKRIISERLTVRRTDEEIEKIIKGKNNMDIMDSFNNKVEEPIQNNNQNNNSNPFNISGTFNEPVVSNKNVENYNSNVNNIEVFDLSDFGSINQVNNENTSAPNIVENNISNYTESQTFNTTFTPNNNVNSINQNAFNMERESMIPQTPIVEDAIPNIALSQEFANPFMVNTNENAMSQNVTEQEVVMPQAPIVEDNEFKKIVNDDESEQSPNEVAPINSNDNFINPVANFNSYNNETVQNNDVVDNEINEEPVESEIKQGRFFNILSQDMDEESNNDVGEVPSFSGFNQPVMENSVTDSQYSMPQNTLDVNNEVPNSNIFNSFTNINPDVQNVSSPINEVIQEENYNPISNNNPFNYNTTPVEPVYDDIEEPVNNYATPSMNEEPTLAEPTLKDIISMIRRCADDIEKQGFELDSEEFDFQDIYQVIFKIKKK